MAGQSRVSAQSCDAGCVAQQVAGQEALLASFNALSGTPAGAALLDANLRTEEGIYLNSTQAQKIAAGTVFITDLVPANILLRAFPQNPNFGYDQAGLPTAPALPAAVAAAVAAMVGNAQLLAMKPFFGMTNTYGNAYGLLPGQTDSVGNPPPYQVSAAILGNPFTAANSSPLAAQNQQTPGAYNVNWVLGDSQIGDFPSAHTMLASFEALTAAVLAPGFYQALAQSVADFAYDLNVYGEHYPLDVIGGRILATYVLAQTLAGNPAYPYAPAVPATFASLSQQMQAYLGGGGDLPQAAACASSLAACVAAGAIPTAAEYAAGRLHYAAFLTYGLPSVGATTLPPIVPAGASSLLATRFPYLTEAQRNEVLATTELPSGVPLDDGSGWARLNLYAAAGGYGALRADVAVTMNAALGGLSAFDIWSNDISGPGGLTLQGSGTLILAGNNSYRGGTNVQGGTLAVTGTLGGNLTIASGATVVSNGGYAVASNAALSNAGTFIAVNAPLVNAGIASNTGVVSGAVSNAGTFANDGVVTGAFANAGMLSGNGVVGSLALLAGSIVAPGNSIGTIAVSGNLTVAPGAVYQAQVSTSGADLIRVGGSAALSGGTVVVTGIGGGPPLGSRYPIIVATGGVTGSFAALTEPARGLAPGTRFDTLYGGNAISLTVTPSFYGNLAAAGVLQSRSQSAVGNALDTIRPAPGVAPDAALSALFDPLYALPAGSIAGGLEQLAPSIYPAAMITARNAWGVMANAVGGQLAARRGLAANSGASSAAGPDGSTIWVSALGGYGSIAAGGGSPGFTAGLGGTAVGIDRAVGEFGRLGVAVGTVEAKTWSQTGGQATGSTAHAVGYGQWQRGAVFATAQLALMYQQETAHRTLPLFGTSVQGETNGLAGGGRVQIGVQQHYGPWLIEPSLGFGGFALPLSGLTETGGGMLAQTVAGATLGSAESTLAVRVQRRFAVGGSVQVVAEGRLGWSHEFADNAACISTHFAGLANSGFAVASAPIGRDAAILGLSADIDVAGWPVEMFVGYGGAISTGSSTQSLNVGVRFIW